MFGLLQQKHGFQFLEYEEAFLLVEFFVRLLKNLVSYFHVRADGQLGK